MNKLWRMHTQRKLVRCLLSLKDCINKDIAQADRAKQYDKGTGLHQALVRIDNELRNLGYTP